ncbi:MAG: hypothetical protein AAGA18_14525 [Verrucomicrobiota bacterium]
MTTPKYLSINLSSLPLLTSGLFSLIFLTSLTLIAQEDTGADPTSVSTEMEEVLRALRASEIDEDDDQNEDDEDEYAEIVGLIVGSNQDFAHIIRIEDELYGVQDGIDVSHRGKDYRVKTITISKIILENKKSGEELILYTTLWAAPQNRILDVPPDQQKEIALINMSNVSLFGVTQAISYVTGAQIAVSSEARGVSVGLSLENVSTSEVLDALALTHGLYVTKVPKTNIIRLHTSQEYARDADSFFEEQTEVFTLKYPNARDIALSIRDLYGDRVQLASQLDDSDEPGEYLNEDLEQRLDRFDTIDTRSRGFGSTDQGGSSNTSNNNNNNRFSRNSRNNRINNFTTRSNQSDREEFVDRIELGDDLSAQEIATLVNDPEALKKLIQARADIYVTVIDRINKLMVRTRDDKTMKEIAALIQELDVPSPLVLLEVRIFTVELERGLDTAFEWSWSEAGSSTSASFAPGGTVTNPTLAFTALDERFSAAMSLLQDKDRLTALGQPTLLMVNNEVSRIFIGEEIPVLTDITGSETIATDAAVIQSEESVEYERRAVGSTLLITPNINDDRTVTLRMLQEESSIRRNGANVLIPDGGTFVERSVDVVTEQSASGTFAAKDGQTIAVGGLIREQITEDVSQIPLLGDIPLIGLAFRGSARGRQREEIIILMTPHIISTPGEGAAISRKVIESQESLHPLLPEAKGSLKLFKGRNVLKPSTDELDWESYWAPRLRGDYDTESGDIQIRQAEQVEVPQQNNLQELLKLEAEILAEDNP